jgi:hypothetical protein
MTRTSNPHAGEMVGSDWKCGRCGASGTIHHKYLCSGITPFKLTAEAHHKKSPNCPQTVVCLGGRFNPRSPAIQLVLMTSKEVA